MEGVIIMMRGNWYKVPAELLNDATMTKADCKVWAYVADRVKGSERPVSVRSVMIATELSRRQCQTSLHKLVDAGYLTALEDSGCCTIYGQTLLKERALPVGSRGKKEVSA